MNNKGFTLIELAIVLAILAIIAAIAVPTFMTTTARARLRSDVQSARVIQNALELHNIERTPITTGTVQTIIERLQTAGYLEENIKAQDIQSTGAVWARCTTLGIVVDITNSPAPVRRAYEGLPDTERRLIIGGDTPVPQPPDDDDDGDD